jgi:lysyl-tRNA synthetase class II
MTNSGSTTSFSGKTARSLKLSALALLLAASIGGQLTTAATQAAKTEKKSEKKTETKAEKKAESKPEPVIENVQNVTSDQLVDKPHDYMNKNVKFDAYFHAFSSLALDYKPAMRSSKNYLSFLILRPNSKVPYSELKLAMAIPKEKDPDNTMLAALKEGDQVEVTGHVFATALDEPWVDVLRLKKLASAPEKKDAGDDADKKAEKADPDKGSEKDKSKDIRHNTPEQNKTP